MHYRIPVEKITKSHGYISMLLIQTYCKHIGKPLPTAQKPCLLRSSTKFVCRTMKLERDSRKAIDLVVFLRKLQPLLTCTFEVMTSCGLGCDSTIPQPAIKPIVSKSMQSNFGNVSLFAYRPIDIGRFVEFNVFTVLGNHSNCTHCGITFIWRSEFQLCN